MVNLSAHFTLEEATESQTATRKGINNQPNPLTLKHMVEASKGMEAIRELLGKPIKVSSWYRSPELNKAIGGAANSAHVDGYAIDFTCESFGSPKKVCDAIINSHIAFDQIIQEYDSWVHVSFAPEMRNEILTAKKVNGKTKYFKGLV